MAQFKEGDRVRNIGYLFSTGIPTGTLGTVATVRGINGVSIYPDPCKRMIFVNWDGERACGVFKNELEKVKKS